MKALYLVLVLALAGGCTTVIPKPAPAAAVASFDGGEQNSGIVRVLPDGSFVVTAHLRDRYNALIALYGAQFVPALRTDAGLAPLPAAQWGMTPQTMVNFVTMVQWHRMARPPQ